MPYSRLIGFFAEVVVNNKPLQEHFTNDSVYVEVNFSDPTSYDANVSDEATTIVTPYEVVIRNPKGTVHYYELFVDGVRIWGGPIGNRGDRPFVVSRIKDSDSSCRQLVFALPGEGPRNVPDRSIRYLGEIEVTCHTATYGGEKPKYFRFDKRPVSSKKNYDVNISNATIGASKKDSVAASKGKYCLATSTAAKEVFYFEKRAEPRFVGYQEYFIKGPEVDRVIIKYRPVSTLQEMGILPKPAPQVPMSCSLVTYTDDEEEDEKPEVPAVPSEPVEVPSPDATSPALPEPAVSGLRKRKRDDAQEEGEIEETWQDEEGDLIVLDSVVGDGLEKNTDLVNDVANMSIIDDIENEDKPERKDDVGTPYKGSSVAHEVKDDAGTPYRGCRYDPSVKEDAGTPYRGSIGVPGDSTPVSRVQVKENMSPMVGPIMSTPAPGVLLTPGELKCSPVEATDLLGKTKARRPLMNISNVQKATGKQVYKYDDDLYMIIEQDDSVICMGDEDCHAVDLTPQHISIVDLEESGIA